MIQDCKFDYIFINDFMNIIEFFIENSPKEKIFNAGSGKKVNLLALANTINKLANYSLPIKIKHKGLNREYTSNSNLLKKEMKTLKLTSIDQAINELYQYYLINKSIINCYQLTENE